MSYQVSSVFLQKFSPKEIHELKRVFKEHDHDYAAAVPVAELHTVLQKLGENVTPNQTTVMLQQIKLARPEQISFQEFLELLHDFRNGAIALDPALLLSHASVAPTPAAVPAPTPVAAPEPSGPAPAAVETTPLFSSQKTTSWQQDQAPEPASQAPAFAQKAQWPPTGTPSTPTAAPAPVASKPQWSRAGQTASWGQTPSSAPQAPALAAVPIHAKHMRLLSLRPLLLPSRPSGLPPVLPETRAPRSRNGCLQSRRRARPSRSGRRRLHRLKRPPRAQCRSPRSGRRLATELRSRSGPRARRLLLRLRPLQQRPSAPSGRRLLALLLCRRLW